VRRDLLQPVSAGLIASIVGFSSTFALVLAGLHAVGATEAQAASGLAALCVGMSVAGIWLALRYRMPIAVAWSTPGAALLISSGPPPGGYPAALGAFAVTGGLIVLAGLWRTLERWVAAIPVALASAMLAGVLLPVCVEPVRGVVDAPLDIGPVVLVWALLMRFARPWAVPGALVAAAVVIAIDPVAGRGGSIAPELTFTAPALDVGALVSLGVPLFLVTMASQNIPGMGVLASFGYRPPLRPALVSTGAATVVGAPFGAHAINLAAITAALMAGPDADPDPGRRWIASAASGVVYLGLGLLAGAAATLLTLAPPQLIEAVAGLALVGALAGAITTAMADAERRDAAVITFVVSASSITAAGISAPFWGLVAGLAFLGLQRIGTRRGRAAAAAEPDEQEARV
jgi:benzoate membrane transport protein